MRKTKTMRKWLPALLGAVMLVLGLAMYAPADEVKTLPEYIDEECWFYLFKNKPGEGWLAEVPNNTKLSNISSNNKNVTVKLKTERWENGKHKFVVIYAKKPGYAKVQFTLRSGSQTKVCNVNKVVAMKYKNFVKTLRIGNTDYASKFNDYDYSYTVRKPLRGKLTVTAGNGFILKGMEIINMEGKVIRKVKNGQNITLKKGQGLHIFYYYKAYKCNGGLGAVWVAE